MKVLRGAAFWLIAFVFSYALWLVHDDSGTLPELLAGVLVAALAATGTELVRRQRVTALGLRARHLRRVFMLVPAAARDCVTLTVLALRQLLHPQAVRGRTVAMPFRDGGEDPDANARRALAAGLGSFAPGTVVIGIDPDRSVVVAHQLGAKPQRSNLDPLELG